MTGGAERRGQFPTPTPGWFPPHTRGKEKAFVRPENEQRARGLERTPRLGWDSCPHVRRPAPERGKDILCAALGNTSRASEKELPTAKTSPNVSSLQRGPLSEAGPGSCV